MWWRFSHLTEEINLFSFLSIFSYNYNYKLQQFSAKFLWLSEIQISNSWNSRSYHIQQFSCGNIARKLSWFLKTKNKLLIYLSYNNNEFSLNFNLILVIELSKENKTYSFNVSVLYKVLANNLIIRQEKIFIGIYFGGSKGIYP